jgi:hypothetical protein
MAKETLLVPDSVNGCRVKYDLDRYRLPVQVIPSGRGDAIETSILSDFVQWTDSDGQRNNMETPLRGGVPHFQR